jgi:putative hemolysin
MPESFVIEIVIIFILILANGFFAASEIAVVQARKGRLEHSADAGNAAAKAALRLAEDPSRFLSTVQIGITVFGTFAAVFGGAGLSERIAGAVASIPLLAPYAETVGAGVVALAISYLSLIVGELVPKRLAMQHAEGIAVFVAPAMTRLARIASPVVSFLTFSTELVLRILGRKTVVETSVTEQDIIALSREGRAGGTVAASEHELITNVFTFSDCVIRSIMTPRTQIVAVAADTPVAEALRIFNESGYSRLPVFADSLDHVVGMLYVKDVLPAFTTAQSIAIRDVMRPAVFILESQRAAAAFQQLKQRRSALAVVLDEYGQVAGVISMEDMIEELVGDIADETDEVDEAFVRRDDGTFLVSGLMPFAAFLERMPVPGVDALVREHGFETFAGFILALLGHIPTVGEVVRWHGFVFEVVDMDGRRIDRVLITPAAPDGAPQE